MDATWGPRRPPWGTLRGPYAPKVYKNQRFFNHRKKHESLSLRKHLQKGRQIATNTKPVLARNGKRVFFGTAFSPIMRENERVQGLWREVQTPFENIKITKPCKCN